jgi:hypothetical protein
VSTQRDGARRTENEMMTTKDGANEITAMGLFKDGLDHDIKTEEESLRNRLESLRREIDRGLDYLAKGYRVNRAGIAQHAAIEIDKLCATLNAKYDLRVALNAALATDTKDGAN